jgi:hypothetical protein
MVWMHVFIYEFWYQTSTYETKYANLSLSDELRISSELLRIQNLILSSSVHWFNGFEWDIGWVQPDIIMADNSIRYFLKHSLLGSHWLTRIFGFATGAMDCISCELGTYSDATGICVLDTIGHVCCCLFFSFYCFHSDISNPPKLQYADFRFIHSHLFIFLSVYIVTS